MSLNAQYRHKLHICGNAIYRDITETALLRGVLRTSSAIQRSTAAAPRRPISMAARSLIRAAASKPGRDGAVRRPCLGELNLFTGLFLLEQVNQGILVSVLELSGIEVTRCKKTFSTASERLQTT
jgi:hypothetical protein